MSTKNARRNGRKALHAIEEVITKYPSGILDIAKITDEACAWLQVKVQHMRECLKPMWHHFSTSTWWEPLRISRNKIAHTKEDLSDESFSQLCTTLFSNIANIREDLNTFIQEDKQKQKKKRKFENSAFLESAFGSINERKQLIDAMEDAIAPIEPKDEVIEFPQNKFSLVAKDTLNEILNKKEIKDYMCAHEVLSENIQTDILEFLKNTQKKLEKDNPFFEEEVFIAKQKKLSASEIGADLSNEKSKIAQEYKELPSVNDAKRGNIQKSSLDFNFYHKEFDLQKTKVKSETKDKKNPSSQWKDEEKLEALKRNFIQDMEKNFIEPKNNWEQEKIDAFRKKFLEELYQKIQNFMKLEKLLSPLIKDFGRLWDLSIGTFETSGFELLETFAKLLEEDESLQELANLLGRQAREQASFKKELRNKIVIKTEWHAKPAYRGEINGLKYSNDIASSLPTEMAFLKNANTKKLFQLKFAQKQLLSFEFQNEVAIRKQEVESEEVSIEKKEPKGPIIICVDTSGSMHGSPENIAKTVTFALAKIAINEERKCFVISFSTDIETLEVKPNEDIEMTSVKEENYIQKLVQFLAMSFNGGTDAEPALKKAIQMLKGEDEKEGYSNADVLMISDFVMNNLSDDLNLAIEAEKNKNTSFYSLVIGNTGNNNTIACFDHNWIYNTNDSHASRHLIEQLQQIKK
ncbi:MAG: VWA domain-containing protein [Treponema sp.]